MAENRSKRWYKLDNAAKIIPGTTKGANTRVFRIVCELNEEIDSTFLQLALEEALREFPYFNCVLRRGLFWYYLDESDLHPIVKKDASAACGPLYFPGRRNLLYKVTYFGKRINLDMFHVLADGTGAFSFLRRIVINYIRMVHEIPLEDRNDRSSTDEKADDAFKKYYQKGKSTGQIKGFISTRAYQLKGPKDQNNESHLIEATVSAGEFVKIAHQYNTTVGIFLSSLMVASILDNMSFKDLKHPISISVPVNLRKYFPSITSRNFFGVIKILFKAESFNVTLEDIIKSVGKSFEDQLTDDRITNTMNSYSGLERNVAVKIIPLFLKDLGIQGISTITDTGVTASVSNIGMIKLPEYIEPYVKQFSAFMSSINMQLTVASYEDSMTFGFCSPFEESPVITSYVRRLTDLGLEVMIATNDHDIPLNETKGGKNAVLSKMQSKNKRK